MSQPKPGNKVVEVTFAKLSSSINSKTDIYRALTIHGQYYLPPFNLCSFEFLNQIMSKKKLVFKNVEVKISNVPQYKALTTERIYNMAYSSDRAKRYLPDPERVSSKRSSREYLCNIMNTLDEHFFQQAIKEIE